MNLDYSTILGLPNNINHIKDLVKKNNANLSKNTKKKIDEIYLQAGIGCTAGYVQGGPLGCAIGATSNVASTLINQKNNNNDDK